MSGAWLTGAGAAYHRTGHDITQRAQTSQYLDAINYHLLQYLDYAWRVVAGRRRDSIVFD